MENNASKDTLISFADIQRQLQDISLWTITHEGKALERIYRTSDFMSALNKANEIAEIAEREGHHPDLEISWGKLTITLSTHSAGGITQKDIALAQKIEKMLQ